MKQIIIFCFVFICFMQSCDSQDLNLKFKGNWQIVKQEKYDVIYQEAFVSDSVIHFYDLNLGVLPRISYRLQDNILFQSEAGMEFEEVGKVIFNSENEFTIYADDDMVTYRRLINQANLLGDYLEYRIDKNEFLKSYYVRMDKWNN